MSKRFFALITIITCFSSTLFAQENVAVIDSIKKPEIKLSFLDSLKNTFVFDETIECIDNQTIKEFTSSANLEIFDGLLSDITTLDLDKPVDYEFSTDLFKERLRLLDEKSPFNIEYNSQLENIVKNFLKNRKKSYERLMGLSQYYFPMFEEALAKYDVPLEIKYLAIVESALNQKAVSRVGATGLWQFMYETGKQYGLKIDSYVDERSDLLKSSDAAARYMAGMYKIFGDWELVLASYNSGAGNVSKAMRRSGGHQNFWNIKSKLPRETAGYVPAFLATMYIFEYHKEHGIVPQKAIVNHFETDTIAVKRKISFKQISELLDVPMTHLEFLNPSYKMKVVPKITGRTNFIRLPKKKIAVFASNEDKVYAYVDYQESKREKQFVPKPRAIKVPDSTAIASNTEVEEPMDVETRKVQKEVKRTKYHTVRRGDNLSDIAAKYDVSLAELKKWNGIKKNNIQAGQRLKIETEQTITVVEKVKKPREKEVVTTTETALAETTSKPEVIEKPVAKKVIEKPVVTEHTVAQGEDLLTIAKKYRMYVTDLKKYNNLKSSAIKAGDVLYLKPGLYKEDVKAVQTKETAIASNTNTDEHIVKKGDNIGNIAKTYNVSIADIKKWNDLKDNSIKVGEKLVVSSPSEAKSVKEVDSLVYVVKKGDNIGNIAKANGVTIEDIKTWNNLKDNNIKVGEKLTIQKEEAVVETTKRKADKYSEFKTYIVQKGDSLYSISQKHRMSVADLKKMNDLQAEDLQPGMKLKIKG